MFEGKLELPAKNELGRSLLYILGGVVAAAQVADAVHQFEKGKAVASIPGFTVRTQHSADTRLILLGRCPQRNGWLAARFWSSVPLHLRPRFLGWPWFFAHMVSLLLN